MWKFSYKPSKEIAFLTIFPNSEAVKGQIHMESFLKKKTSTTRHRQGQRAEGKQGENSLLLAPRLPQISEKRPISH